MQNDILNELEIISKIPQILKERRSFDDSFKQICNILPLVWQYPDYACARIRYNNRTYKSAGFKQTQWVLKDEFVTINDQKGFIDIYYLEEFAREDEGPFLNKERQLLKNITKIILGSLNSKIALETKKKPVSKKDFEQFKATVCKNKFASRNLLQKFLKQSNFNRDIYHDLMPYKVKEILLVANLYDAYNIEKEGRFSEHVLGEYKQLNLTSLPRITGVSGQAEVFRILSSKHFDIILFMLGVDKKSPIELCKKVKKEYPHIPTFMLLNNSSDISLFEKNKENLKPFNRVFVWNGESKAFFSIIKNFEDSINIHNDTDVALVRVILLVEDSIRHYSLYLPLLYKIVLEQTKRIIDDVTTDELYRVLKLRARPKIILATSYEEAINIVNKYKDYLLCLITDVEYENEGKLDPEAGLKLAKRVRELIPDLPTIIQSSNPDYAEKASNLKAIFINKNSDSLVKEFKNFLTQQLGFGDFIFKNKEGIQVAVAKTLKEFEQYLKLISYETLIYHSNRNDYSHWLAARGEIQVANIIYHGKVSDFDTTDEVRNYLLEVIQEFKSEKNKGKVIPFEESAALSSDNISSLTEGTLGGKGRGLAFIDILINNFDFEQLAPGIHIKTPITCVIGIDEYEYFMESNDLYSIVFKEESDEIIKESFLKGCLSIDLIQKLEIILNQIKNPIAIRSSGLFEDSLTQPFSGVFATFLLPNNHPDDKVRLKQTTDAIKMVFASVFSDISKKYIESIHYKIEEEKMAVIIQEVVGNRFEKVFYPHISGVAQSHNYYPYAHMKPEEGFVVAAVGLGKYVVEGGKAHRFSPKFPEIEINSPRLQNKNSQVEFYAVDLNKKDINILEGEMAGLIKLDITEAEKHGTIKHCASVFDVENDTIVPGITHNGPRIINFSNILKYNYIPLAKTIESVLDIVQEAMGSPVEIEFAVDLNKDKDNKASFYLLQIKPLIGNAQDYNINIEEVDKSKVIVFSEIAMGNGVVENIYDVIYVENKMFDKSDTIEMANEIEHLNTIMLKSNKKYVLIGPGRWGTRDKWIGIPVTWPQISNARIIIEASLKGYPLDASYGSHFFHNVTSMNIGYFSIQPELSKGYIKWDILKKQKLVNSTKHFRHIRFSKPLSIKMDGKKRISVISL